MAEKSQEALAASVLSVQTSANADLGSIPWKSGLDGLLVQTDFFTSFFPLLKMLHIVNQKHVRNFGEGIL